MVLSQRGSANSLTGSTMLSSVSAAAPLSLADVASIDVTISGVQAILRGEDEDGGGWVDLQLAPAR